MTNPYDVLGVQPNASDEEITKAYRTLARRYHPDTHPGDQVAETKMKEINAAYEQIKDIRAGKSPDPSAQGQTSEQFWQNFDQNYSAPRYNYSRSFTISPTFRLILRVIGILLVVRLVLGLVGCGASIFGSFMRMFFPA